MRLQFFKTKTPGLFDRLNRRSLFKRTGLAAFAGALGIGGNAEAETMRVPVTTYESLGVEPVINCWGTMTILGGSLMPPEIMKAMEEANKQYVYMPELFEGVGRRLSELTGAEWGCVTSGAAAAIYAASAACVAGDDPEKMAKLPDTTGMKNEAIIPGRHYTGYHDAACRMVGLKLIRVDSKAEMEAAINDKTAIVHILGEISRPNYPGGGNLAYKDIIKIARKHGVPTMVDAAAERPDMPDYYLESGSDLVCYSGGKCLRGPQSAGLLIGREDICRAAVKNLSPYGGIGRPMKVGKEEIMGVLTALELWLYGRDHKAEFKEWERILAHISRRIKQVPTVRTKVIKPGRPSNVTPTMLITWDEKKVRLTHGEFHNQLLEGYPRIKIAGSAGGSTINPYMMRPGDEVPVARRMYGILSSAALSE